MKRLLQRVSALAGTDGGRVAMFGLLCALALAGAACALWGVLLLRRQSLALSDMEARHASRLEALETLLADENNLRRTENAQRAASPTPTPTSAPTRATASAATIRPLMASAVPNMSRSLRTVRLYPVADTYVSAASPEQSHGSEGFLEIGVEDGEVVSYALLKFDLSILPLDRVKKVTLLLEACPPDTSGGTSILIGGVRHPWDDTITYQEALSQGPIGADSGVVYSSQRHTSVEIGLVPSFMGASDLAAFMGQGLALSSEIVRAAPHTWRFCSSESVPDLRPALEAVY